MKSSGVTYTSGGKESREPKAGFMGFGSNPGEDMDVCKCIVSLRHGGTLNRRQAASSLVRLVEGEERWEATDYQGVLLNWGGTELNRTFTCMVLKATANDRRTCNPLP
ncbi:uncharacterized protein TNCV_1431851 [Trichonephila clavipes]|nr:uncharacterized protein TNCV_1431851 [Trichonephila clavipes]